MAKFRTSVRLALAVATAAGALGGATAPTAAQTVTAPSGIVQIATSRGRLVTVDASITDVFVADPTVADVSVRSTNQFWVFGKKTGETTVYAVTKSGKVVYSTNLRVGNNFDSLDGMLKMAMPEADITATTMNGVVLLTGTIASPADGAEAERLVQAFVGEDTRVVSRLRTATPLQVNLQVRIAEVSRSFIKNIGVNLQTRDRTGGFQFNVASGRSIGTIGPANTANFPQLDASSLFGLPAGSLALPFDPRRGTFVYPGTGTAFNFNTLPGPERTALGFATRLAGLDILSAIDLGETLGQVTTLANPNLTALSGETGTFLAGGEIPIPLSQGFGAVTVQFKQYGVSLAYTPTVLSDGRISLRVRPEVSQITSVGAVTINDYQVPALTTRRAETTVELGSGQSFMIAGLIQNNQNNQIEKAPGLGDLPVLGALFRSNGFRRDETELVIVITPYLVKPVNASEIALPTDGYKAPTDVERVLLGQLTSGRSGEQRPVPTMAPPVQAAPSFGAAAPALPAGPTLPAGGTDAVAAPLPVPPQAEDGKRRRKSDKKGKAATAAPGFSFN